MKDNGFSGGIEPASHRLTPHLLEIIETGWLDLKNKPSLLRDRTLTYMMCRLDAYHYAKGVLQSC
jgi:hypothetical protein